MATRVTLMLVAAAGLAMSWGPLLQRFRLENIEDLRNTAAAMSRGWEGAGSSIVLDIDFTSTRSIIGHIPFGVLTALFRPLPGEVRNPFGLLAGLENALIIVLLFRVVPRARRSDFADPLVRWAIAVVLLWAVVYGFAAYNLGSLVRFKLQILPIFLLILLYLGRPRDVDGTERSTAQ
jgi:hypothetical protein